MTNEERKRLFKRLAELFTDRAATLGYKGKKRDDAALDYFVGASVALELAGDPDTSQSLAIICAMMISVRGYVAVRELATAEE